MGMGEQTSGADGVKIAVFRKGLASAEFIRAAAHFHVRLDKLYDTVYGIK